jgi:membrane-bound ClpP family serine protease
MTVTLVILLLLAAITLILIEILIIPGIGITGVGGLILMLSALVIAYNIDAITGHITLVATILASIGLILLAFRSKTWDKMSQTEEIKSHVDQHTGKLNVGDKGIAISRLNPIGNVEFKDERFEASSIGEFIDATSRVEIINIEGNKIIVKPI